MFRYFLLLVMIGLLPIKGADWDQWRGSYRNGQTGYQLPKTLPDQLTRVWRVEVGEGHSSPLVVEDYILLFSRVGDQETIRKISISDGSFLWTSQYPAPYTMHSAATGHGKGPKATPLLLADKVITFGIDGILTATDLKDGHQVWQQEFSSEFPKTSPLFGVAASPIAWDGKVVVHVGGNDNGALVMLDAATGKVEWRLGVDGPGYASPILVKSTKGEQLITQTQLKIIGVDAKGSLLWERKLETPYLQNSVTPLFSDGLLVYSGLDAGSFALSVNLDQPEVVWENKEIFSYMSSPVAVNGRLYLHSPKRKGMFVCQDLKSGKMIWGSEGKEGDNAALLVAGKRILALTTDARLIIFGTDTENYSPEKTYEVADSPTWAHPALVDGNRLVVKDKAHLTLFKF